MGRKTSRDSLLVIPVTGVGHLTQGGGSRGPGRGTGVRLLTWGGGGEAGKEQRWLCRSQHGRPGWGEGVLA